MTKTVLTAGVWDLFHRGHLNIIKRAKEYGRLIVAVSTDELVKSYKNEYPVFCLKDRIEVLKACRYVDEVIVQTKILDINQLKEHKVDIIVIGDDWKDKYLEGLEWMKEHGKVIYVPYTKGISTSLIKQKLQ